MDGTLQFNARAADRETMPLFPDEFPFKRPQNASEAPVAPLSIPEVATPVVAPSQERRKSPRQTLVARAMIRIDSTRGPASAVEMINLSMLGVRFRSTEPYNVGEKAAIRLEVGPLRWTTRLRVVHTVQSDNGSHVIGCAFIGNELVRAKPTAQAA